MYSAIELINTIIMPFTLLYGIMFLVLFAQKYLREYRRNKRLLFTQSEIKDKKNEINLIIISTEKGDNIDNIIINTKELLSIFSIYNEIAVGINEGIYDETYTKLTIGYEMISFYKKNRFVVSQEKEVEMQRFLPLEILLERWSNSDNRQHSSFRRRKY